MFIHWGHVSRQGIELSWPLVGGVGSLPGAKGVAVGKRDFMGTLRLAAA